MIHIPAGSRSTRSETSRWSGAAGPASTPPPGRSTRPPSPRRPSPRRWLWRGPALAHDPIFGEAYVDTLAEVAVSAVRRETRLMSAELGLLPLNLPPLKLIEEEDRRPRRGRRPLVDRPRCKRCRHPVRTDLSLHYRLGPTCAKRLGVKRSRRGAAARPGWPGAVARAHRGPGGPVRPRPDRSNMIRTLFPLKIRRARWIVKVRRKSRRQRRRRCAHPRHDPPEHIGPTVFELVRIAGNRAYEGPDPREAPMLPTRHDLTDCPNGCGERILWTRTEYGESLAVDAKLPRRRQPGVP